jgi:hypothetical protein
MKGYHPIRKKSLMRSLSRSKRCKRITARFLLSDSTCQCRKDACLESNVLVSYLLSDLEGALKEGVEWATN